VYGLQTSQSLQDQSKSRLRLSGEAKECDHP
jgi:hypothetical protein